MPKTTASLTACKQLSCSKAAAGLAAPLETALVLKGRCRLPARTAWKQLWCSNAAAGCQPAPLSSSFGVALRTAWKQLWCSKAAAGCQPAPALGSGLGVQKSLRAAITRSALLGSSFGAQRPLRAAATHCLEAALVLKRRCGLPARTAGCYSLHLEAALLLKGGCQSKAAAGCQPAPLRTAWKQLSGSNAAAGCQPAPLASSFGAQRLLWAASLHRLEAALVLKGFSVELSCGPTRLEGALVLKGRCGLPARTA